jgi:type I restriction enzyme S subunit
LRKAALVNFSGLCSADIYPLKVVRDDQLLPEFLRWTLVSKPFTEYAVGLSRRARMPKLNRKQIFDYHFHLPNLSEQRRMVGYLDNVQQQVNAIERVQRDTEMELQRLEQSILDRAFHGEL